MNQTGALETVWKKLTGQDPPPDLRTWPRIKQILEHEHWYPDDIGDKELYQACIEEMMQDHTIHPTTT